MIISSFLWNPKTAGTWRYTSQAIIRDAPDTQTWLSHAGRVCEGGQRERGRHKERQRWKQRERGRKKGARGGKEIRACHLHILDIRVWDERVGAEMKKQNESIYSSLYCMWAILCNFAFISTERVREKKNTQRQPLRESWTLLGSIILKHGKSWMRWWEVSGGSEGGGVSGGGSGGRGGCLTSLWPHFQFKSTRCQARHLNFGLC